MLTFQTGNCVDGYQQVRTDNQIVVVDSNGRCLFEISINKDHASIEVRGVQDHKIKDVVHTSSLIVKPNYTNSVTIRTEKYEG